MKITKKINLKDKVNLFLLIYYLIGALLGSLFIPNAITLIIHPIKVESEITLPLLKSINTTIIVQIVIQTLLTIGVFIFVIGLVLTRTDLIILSIFLVHIILAVIYPEYTSTVFGKGVYGITLQMLSLTIIYLIIHNFSIRGRVKLTKIRVKRKLSLEALNLIIIFIGPIALAYFFLILTNLVLSAITEAVNKLPPAISGIVYVYLLNPYSQLFTVLTILGGIIWILRNILEQILLYLRVGSLIAKEMVIKEFNELKKRVENKDLKIKIGALPKHSPSIRGILPTIALALGIITIIFLYSGFENIPIFIHRYVNFLEETLGVIPKIPLFSLIPPEYFSDIPRVKGEYIVINLIDFISNLFIRFRGMIIWLERLIRFLFWWIWR